MIRIKKKVQKEEILACTNGGYDIFRHYLGTVKRIMKRPWGSEEKKASWGVYPHFNGIWLYKDLAKDESGDAIVFVSKLFGITYPKAIDKILFDFGLGGEEVNAAPVQVTWKEPDPKEFISINFTSKPFTKLHHEFWNAAEVSEGHCNRYNCWAVKDLAIDRKRVSIKDEVVFAYLAEEENAVKIYFPYREKGERFRNNVSYKYLWNFSQLEQSKPVIIQKSMKDLIVTSLVRPNIIATQAESPSIFSKPIVDKIRSISNNITLFYGSDDDGFVKSQKICNLHSFNNLYTPRDLLPDINDSYGFVKRFGIKTLESYIEEHEK